MLSKCANPDCSEVFRYLHEGKIFCLSPTPEVETVTRGRSPSLYERFWLCDRCARELTLVWGGTETKLVPRSDKTERTAKPAVPPAPEAPDSMKVHGSRATIRRP